MSQYRVLPGPEHFLPPSAASMGIYLPNPGEAHINGVIVPEEKAYEEAAKQLREFFIARRDRSTDESCDPI